jgi:tRNA-Thr(GGU) m(6)t(6)A37 methyltransferase TsaA
MSFQQRFTTYFCASVGLGIILTQAVLLYKSGIRCDELEKELEHEHTKRAADRTGRIRLQQKAREKVKEDLKENGGQHMTYIGHVRSPFPDRRGTPRQPLLVPAAHGRIVFDKRFVQREHFQELSQFSHIFVLFVFHENTNTDSKNIGKVSNAKIAPPRLAGAKVGCLSTRSPHRPNPIGLSVCEVLGVGDDYIDIKSVDFVDGTPILDVKPYIPYDVVPLEINGTGSGSYLPMACSADGSALQKTFLRVPDWIREADIPMRSVEISSEASKSLHDIFDVVASASPDNIPDGGTAPIISKVAKGRSPRFCRSFAHAVELMTQVLRQDVRGVRQGRGQKQEQEQEQEQELEQGQGQEQEQRGEISTEKPPAQTSFMCRLDSMEINVSFHYDRVVVESVTSLI